MIRNDKQYRNTSLIWIRLSIPREELLANFRSTIERFRPQLEKPSHSDEELGALINAGFKKGSGLMQYWVLGRKIDKKALFICINAQVPQFMNEICFKFAFGLLL